MVIELEMGAMYRIDHIHGHVFYGKMIAYKEDKFIIQRPDDPEICMQFDGHAVAGISKMTSKTYQHQDEYSMTSSALLSGIMDGVDYDGIYNAITISRGAKEFEAAIEAAVALDEIVDRFYGYDGEDDDEDFDLD